ncbi:X-Pro dipeptidyl-peptidase (S15 family) [Halopseudomonas xinjiangensis]|uniref:X-Pro dipeptidyl-peptidase (S15 family) n=1 Tax=Halopseudomonas xinjiangensis TaxID=487184 RepID=A0A1H1T4F9_9GAMM|nr:CocE/NonD family hydrolase [Halopseudomonas xinjiangensis]SDS55107.1 X-Pro dipeptidyl-peptidase (S15 family) [Halopseudomonas xinjiangensis]
MTRKPYLGLARGAALSLAIASAALAGMTTLSAEAAGNSSKPIAGAISGGGTATTQQKYDVSITSFDGTEIAVTIYQPRLEQGQPAPLLMYSHGWSGSRSTDLSETDSLTEAARKAWESGYFVLTFDQRGFGDSGGQANVQDPEIEGRDIQALLDWAEANLAPHLAYLRGDPLVGGLGVSYGGGFQLVGSSVDARFDALVPIITWHDLSYSLTPDGVPKTAWLSFLSGVAAMDQAPWVTQSYVESLSGTASEASSARLASHGLGAYCQPRTDGAGVPDVDALFIQGVNDTLFNANEATWNYNCLRQAGNDAYLLITKGGHVLPALQDGSDGGLTNLGGLYNDVQCGDTRYSIADLSYSFLDAKLRKLQRDVAIPRVCLTQSGGGSVVTEEMPTGGMELHVDSGNMLVGPPSIDVVLNLLRKLDPGTLADVLSVLSADTASLLTSALTGLITVEPERVTAVLTELVETLPPALLAELGTAPRFVPLYRVSSDQTLAGLPLADLRIDGEAALDPRVFVGVGVKRRFRLSPELLGDQILPLRGTGERQTELVGVSTELRYGDEVGLMLYGFHPQYTLGFSHLPSAVKLTGTVQLPLH